MPLVEIPGAWQRNISKRRKRDVSAQSYADGAAGGSVGYSLPNEGSGEGGKLVRYGLANETIVGRGYNEEAGDSSTAGGANESGIKPLEWAPGEWRMGSWHAYYVAGERELWFRGGEDDEDDEEEEDDDEEDEDEDEDEQVQGSAPVLPLFQRDNSGLTDAQIAFVPPLVLRREFVEGGADVGVLFGGQEDMRSKVEDLYNRSMRLLGLDPTVSQAFFSCLLTTNRILPSYTKATVEKR